jgi:transcriptional regulator with XRE-family HTH domain
MQWGLTQPELAGLLGVTESALSKFESQALAPTKKLMLGVQVIFGQDARKAFPALYAQSERTIMRRAAAFSVRLEECGDAASKRKLKLLSEMIQRSEPNNNHL